MAKEAVKIENQEESKSVELTDIQKEALAYLFKEYALKNVFYILESGECFDNKNLALNAVNFDESKITTVTRDMFNSLKA